MRRRVQCDKCKAHRDLTIAPNCFVCGHARSTDVVPTAGDLEVFTDELVAAAEAVDVVLYRDLKLDGQHPSAMRLKRACRKMSLARAGVTCQ